MREVVKDDTDELESFSDFVTRESEHLQLPGKVNQENIPSSPSQASPHYNPRTREREGELLDDLITPYKAINLEKKPETSAAAKLREVEEEEIDTAPAFFWMMKKKAKAKAKAKEEGLIYSMSQEPLGRVLLELLNEQYLFLG